MGTTTDTKMAKDKQKAAATAATTRNDNIKSSDNDLTSNKPSNATLPNNMKNTNEGDATTTQAYRKMPLLSEVVFFPVILLYGCLHWTLHPISKHLEGTVGMLLFGSHFGLYFIPAFFYWGAIRALEYYAGVPSSWMWYGVVLPFLLTYTVRVLILDKTHFVVKDCSTILPRNFVERGYMAFCKDATEEYMPVECIPWSKTAKLDPDKLYIFGVHPHGIHCIPLLVFITPGNDFDQLFPGFVARKLTGIAASIMFHLPVIKENFFRMGYIDASRKTCAKALEHGRSLYIVVGGEEESMHTTQGKDIVVLQKRKGFIRLALSYGADLVPVFGVGVTDTYQTYSIGLKWRLWLQKKAGIAVPIFHGRWFTPIPYRVPLKILIGKPIPTPKPKVFGAKPDDALVDEYHAKYIEALKAMHAEHVPDRTLIVK